MRVKFNPEQYYRLASLLNIALYNSLYGWVIENVSTGALGLGHSQDGDSRLSWPMLSWAGPHGYHKV